MHKRIWIVIGAAAFVLGTLASTSADAWWSWRTVEIDFTGSSLIVSTEDGRPTPLGGVFTSMQSGIAKGGGRGVFSALTVAEATLPDERCDPLFGGDLSTNIVVTYHDGSQLQITSGEGSFFCTDGADFFATFEGEVNGGTKRYEGATGTWSGSAEVVGARVSAEATVDLD